MAYDCTPHLDYDVFVSGRLEEQVREFLRGVAMIQSSLSPLGATDEQASAFALILCEAPDRIVEPRLDQTRHQLADVAATPPPPAP